MTDLEAILIIETDNDATEESRVAAWQHLIDTGAVWGLQGFYGRNAHRLIELGICRPAMKETQTPL